MVLEPLQSSGKDIIWMLDYPSSIPEVIESIIAGFPADVWVINETTPEPPCIPSVKEKTRTCLSQQRIKVRIKGDLASDSSSAISHQLDLAQVSKPSESQFSHP